MHENTVILRSDPFVDMPCKESIT